MFKGGTCFQGSPFCFFARATLKKGTIIAQSAGGNWLLFSEPRTILCATLPCQIDTVMCEVETARAAGSHVAGFLAYEAASAFDPALVTYPPDDFPLAWFGIYDSVQILKQLPEPTEKYLGNLDWVPDTDRIAYGRALDKIRAWIQSGDTYQVNYTIRLRSAFSEDPYTLFVRLCQAQAARCAVYADLGDWAVCSASPELFFETHGDTILTRPMKGTAARGLTYASDMQNAHELADSTKNRAENVMIVDMIRNDLGHIAVPGSISPEPLFEVERYPTLYQMVSTVKARTQGTFRDIVHALFPCASITGAPKVRTMQIIRDLETSPRHFYTGMAGYCLADGTSRFNVMIRTVTVDKKAQVAEYGVGGGIVWDSVEQQEYDECLTKAAVLTHMPPQFSLLETLRYDPPSGFAYVAEHCERAADSAQYFGYPYDVKSMLDALQRAVKGKSVPQRVRWLLAADGGMEVTSVDLQPLDGRPIAVAGIGSCCKEDVFLYHKTTHRAVYDKALSAFPNCRDVILVNEDGEVTESCLANVVFQWNGESFTPPVECGLLDGTMRRALVASGELKERRLMRDEIWQVERIWLINSVRGWMEVPRERLVADM